MAEKLMKYADAVKQFDPVIGLETHVELSTNTKLFCPAHVEFGGDPNTQLTPVSLGLPGSLPVLNEAAVDYAIKLGLALHCEIAEWSQFSRKNYFYPDMPRNYQISQYDKPTNGNGYLDVELDDGTIFRVPIERAHIEDDAGKNTHVGGADGRIEGADHSLVDYNRAGVPLVEIVTKPIVGAGKRAPELARAYVAAVREIVKNLGVSDAKMERGNVRCDANVSLMPKDAQKFGTRTETKNVNSLRAVEHAVRFEIERHAAVLDSGAKIVQETRHWHEDTRSTTSGRPKSDADDYRYFPEPDLVPIITTAEWVEELRSRLPEPPADRRKRLKADWGYADKEFRDVVNAGVLDEIEATIAAGTSAAVARKWWMGEIARLAKAADKEIADLGVTPQTIVELNSLIEAKKINDKIARQVLEFVLEGEGSPTDIVEKRSLAVVNDDDALGKAVDDAMAAMPDVVEKIKGGKMQAIGALMGPVMKATRGQADAGRVREIVMEKLGL